MNAEEVFSPEEPEQSCVWLWEEAGAAGSRTLFPVGIWKQLLAILTLHSGT